MTRRARATSVLLLASFLLVAMSTFAFAAEEGPEEGGGDEVTSTTVDTGLVPAVEMGESGEAATETDWTYRYMIPTALVLAAVIVVLTAIKYFTDVVRKRYRIVE